LEGLSHTSRPSMHCALQFWEGGVLSVTSARFMDPGIDKQYFYSGAE
jgi:hypothetical protein